MKQTAVEWLQEQLKKGVDFNPLDKNSYLDNVEKLFNQAKAMEKEQMFAFTRHYHIIGEATNVFYKHEFEQYYNETYGKDSNAGID